MLYVLALKWISGGSQNVTSSCFRAEILRAVLFRAQQAATAQTSGNAGAAGGCGASASLNVVCNWRSGAVCCSTSSKTVRDSSVRLVWSPSDPANLVSHMTNATD